MNWIENHPFKMGFICCGIISLFAFGFHYLNTIPHDWGMFVLWLPITWVLPLGTSIFSYLTERRKKDGCSLE
ncbi:MAG: hypothetical protein ACTSXY_12410 [Promethearchaeota archaeon]